ncbi:MAG: queuosine precursor transporter [Desulfovibrionaceae bacterium]|nr:queuosine precursor transporter [Desulfovibrionaceae bacterium]
MNEILWFGFAILDLCMVLAVYRVFGRTGLFGMVVLSLVLCNIQVLKTVQIFGLTTTLGNVLYASVFLSTDLLSEYHGKQEAKKAVLLGFVALGLAAVYMQLALLFVPAASDFAQPHLEAVFGFLPRVALGSMAAYLASQLHDVWAFHYIKGRTRGRHLWLRNNLSTMVSQLLDTVIFCFVALWGLFPAEVWLEIVLTTYVMKFLMAALDTPFMYLAGRMRRPGTDPQALGSDA